jgi:hypothetical protein
MSRPDSRPPAHDAPTPEATRGVRMVAMSVGALFLLLVAGFVAMVFFVQEEARLNAVGPIAAGPGAERGGLVFRGTANIWEVRGRMTLDAQRQVRFGLDLIGPTGQPAPASLDFRIALDRPEHDMTPLRPGVVRTGPGAYAASAALPQAGQWRLRIELPEITGVFLFDVDE